MNRLRTDERPVENYRTVTEIVDSENLYQKNFDVTDLPQTNEAYYQKLNKRELYTMTAHYIDQVVKQLDIPDIRILFSSNNSNDKLFSFVYYSLAFVNHQILPHTKRFIDMGFVKIEDRKMSVPTDPIVFYKTSDSSKNDINDKSSFITCFVDAANILRILEKPVDVNMKFESDDSRTEMYKLIDKIKTVEKKHSDNNCIINHVMFVDNEKAPHMDETYITPFITLLILFSNTYLDLFKLMRSDFSQYFRYMTDHESLIKERSLPNVNNLITGRFTFKIEVNENNSANRGIIFKN
nr:ODV-E27 [Darna trima granulovirus]